MFPYHVYLDNGLVTESNLPVVSTLPVSEPGMLEFLDEDVFDTDDDEDEKMSGDTQARVPVVRITSK
jgi:hypothetical protein